VLLPVLRRSHERTCVRAILVRVARPWSGSGERVRPDLAPLPRDEELGRRADEDAALGRRDERERVRIDGAEPVREPPWVEGPVGGDLDRACEDDLPHLTRVDPPDGLLDGTRVHRRGRNRRHRRLPERRRRDHAGHEGRSPLADLRRHERVGPADLVLTDHQRAGSRERQRAGRDRAVGPVGQGRRNVTRRDERAGTGCDPDAVAIEEDAALLPSGEQVEGRAEASCGHARTPANNWVMPPESCSRRAAGKPAPRSIASIALGGGRYAIDLGRYA
jgi:hypothetical protein